jgi:hypothetical protein
LLRRLSKNPKQHESYNPKRAPTLGIKLYSITFKSRMVLIGIIEAPLCKNSHAQGGRTVVKSSFNKKSSIYRSIHTIIGQERRGKELRLILQTRKELSL